MKRKHLLFALRVFVLLFLQIVVCNELFLWRFATPFVYPVLLFFFPLGTKKYLYTLSGGIVGLIMDAASGAAGLHTAAFTFTAFLFGYMLPYFVVTDAQPGGKIEEYPLVTTVSPGL